MAQHQPTQTIGFIAPYVGGTYYGVILEGIYQVACRHGLRLIVAQSRPEATYMLRVAHELVDGWITVMGAEGLQQIADVGLPIVAISTSVPGVPAVLPDNYQSSRVLVRHLIEHGHRRIAFLGRRAHVDTVQRFVAYQDALADAQIPLDQQLILDTRETQPRDGQEAAQRLLQLGMPCTAIVAATDTLALGALEAMQAAGYRVPEDVALVGFDDILQAQTSTPPLTTVRLSFEALGSTAANLLLSRIGGQTLPDITYVPTTPIMRRSCGCDLRLPQLTQPLADSDSADGWKLMLARELVAQLDQSLSLDPAMTPDRIWPGVTTLIEALDGALQGKDPPASGAMEAAWAQAIPHLPDLEALETALDLFEQTARRHLYATTLKIEQERVALVLRLIRKEMMRARLSYEVARLDSLDGIMRTNHRITRAILGTMTSAAPQLDWMHYTPATWGCLGVWNEEQETAVIEVKSVYHCDDRAITRVGERYRLAAFPPIGNLAQDRQPERPDITFMLPIYTSNHNWGLVAFGGAFKPPKDAPSDSMDGWPELLGTALDRARLIAQSEEQDRQLREQQVTLQAAYERARILADTLRAVGCPVIPLVSGVLLIPLIGAIDSERARQIIAVVLEAVSRERAVKLLLDVTGVPVVDTQVASALIQLASMASLLGAQTMLVGVRPEIAQSIVGLGIDLQSIVAHATLAEAMRSLQRH